MGYPLAEEFLLDAGKGFFTPQRHSKGAGEWIVHNPRTDEKLPPDSLLEEKKKQQGGGVGIKLSVIFPEFQSIVFRIAGISATPLLNLD